MGSSAPGLASSPRVLHLDTGTSWRGGQLQVLLLHRELLGMGVASRVLARAGGGLEERLRELPSSPPPATAGHPWGVATLAAVHRAVGGADLVHAHDPHAGGLAALALAMTGRGRRPPLVCHRRVSYPPRRGAFDRWKRRRVDGWIAVATDVERVLVGSGVPADTISVVPSAIDVDGVRGAAAAADLGLLRRELGIPDGRPVVGVTGALEAQKGHRVLIEAAARILAAAPGTVFLLVGDGAERAALERLAAGAGIAGQLRLAGFRRDVAPLVALYTVAVAPSLDGEGSSAAVKEAMALARPVVASDLPGTREVLADAGVLVPAADAGRLADAVVGLLADPVQRRGLGRHGAARAELFRPERMAAGVAAVYREVLERAGGGGR